MFEMYIYTMGDKAYAIEIAKLLDPSNIYFPLKVISNSDCTQRHQKGLDVILGAESVAVILDDTEYVSVIISMFACWFQSGLISQPTVFSSHNKLAPAILISLETN